MDDMRGIQTHKIMDMEAQKRERVISAAMKVFSRGYKNAHTDDIVREAGISKGLLFHYFGSKEKLYGFILRYSADVVVSEFFGLMNFEQRDILERIWQMLLLKMDLICKYPMIFEFIAMAYTEGRSEFTEIYNPVYAGAVSKMTDGIDKSLFKEDIEPEKAVNIINWSIRGYSDALVAQTKDVSLHKQSYARYLDEIKDYFTMFKKLFYKEETQ